MVQVRTWCGSPIVSHQSTNDAAGRLHNNALRICAEQHWACSKTSAGITCKFLGLSLEPELRLEEAYLETDYTYSYNRYTTISKTDTCRALRLTSLAVCHLSFMSCWSSRLTCLRSSRRCTVGCYRSFAAMEVFLILWPIRHASLQPTLCTSLQVEHGIANAYSSTLWRPQSQWNSRSIISALFEVHCVTSAELWKHPEVYLGYKVELPRGRKTPVFLLTSAVVFSCRLTTLYKFNCLLARLAAWAVRHVCAETCLFHSHAIKLVIKYLYKHLCTYTVDFLWKHLGKCCYERRGLYFHEWLICRLF